MKNPLVRAMIDAPSVPEKKSTFYKSKQFIEQKFNFRKRLGIAKKPTLKLDKKKTNL